VDYLTQLSVLEKNLKWEKFNAKVIDLGSVKLNTK
jgi:hypothetical protein